MEENKVQSELPVSSKGLLTANKSDITNRVKEAVAMVRDGYVDKIDAYVFAKKFESFGKELAAQLKPLAETIQIPKNFSKFNADITEGMLGVKWDYSGCDDPEYDDLVDQQKELEKKIKLKEQFLQGITKPIELVDTETGETYTINPPVKSGQLGFTVKLK